jgi:hypothetical protein
MLELLSRAAGTGIIAAHRPCGELEGLVRVQAALPQQAVPQVHESSLAVGKETLVGATEVVTAASINTQEPRAALIAEGEPGASLAFWTRQ